MPAELPEMSLSQGQLLWAVNYGRDPDTLFRNQVRYLRSLDIPPASARQASGAGRRILYDFYDLVEAGVASTGLDLGSRPKDIAAVLVDKRDAMRKHYADTWHEIPEAALQGEWIKSRGRIKTMFGDEIFIRLHDRRSDKWGQVDVVGQDEATAALPMFEPVERFPGEAPRRLVPLKRLMIQWVAWAQEAPATRPGRR